MAMEVIDWDCHGRRCGGGFTFYPYQISLGLTLRYWHKLYAPNIRFHIGPFKAWFYVKLKIDGPRG